MGNLFLGKTNYVFPLYQRLGSHELNMIFTFSKGCKKKKKWQKHWQKIFADSPALLYYIIYFCSSNCSTPFKKKWNALWICMSSFSRGHANLLYIIPVLVSAAEASTFRFFYQNHPESSKMYTGTHSILWNGFI